MNKLKLAGCIILFGCNVVAFTLNQNFEHTLEATFEKSCNAAVLCEYIEKIKAIEEKFLTEAQDFLEHQLKINNARAEDSAISVTSASENYAEIIALPLYAIIVSTDKVLTDIKAIAAKAEVLEAARNPELLAQLKVEFYQATQRIRKASNALVLQTGRNESINCDSSADATKKRWANEEHNTETRNNLQSIFKRQ